MYADPGQEGSSSYEGNPYEYGQEEESGVDAEHQPVPEWDDYEPGISEAPPRRDRPRNYAALETSQDHRSKMLHDKPPHWDGEKPEQLLKPYLKEMSLWLKTTDTPKKRQGMAIMGYASGKLKQIIDALEEDQIVDDSGGMLVMEHIQKQYQHYVDKRLPIAIDRVLYSRDAYRSQNEGMLEYLARKKTLFIELDREKCVLPQEAKGYLLLKHANLSEKQRDRIDTWCEGNYDLERIADFLRKLESDPKPRVHFNRPQGPPAPV